MEIRELTAFIVLAEELNFRKAADRLNMSQPPLTRLINQMEENLGVKLLTRTTRHVELTGAGLHLLKRSRDILEEMRKLEFEVRALQKTKTGKLSLSLSGPAFHSEVPRLISSFKEQFPKISVELVECPVNSIPQNLKTAKIDMAFGASEFKDGEIMRLAVQTSEIGLLLAEDHPLSRKKEIKLKDLEGQTLIYHGKHEHLGFQTEFLEFLRNKNIRPKVYYKKSKESCGKLAMMGTGVLITSRSMAHASPGTVYIPFSDYSPKIRIYANWSEANPSLPLRAFLNFLEEKSSAPGSDMDYHLA